ncbi:MAG TPA: exonuclease domain-containing protein [Bacteroidota bacterium]|jgi:DNA polymerase III epsilon subunit family exonuclease|nr:exonuclease domain-containing protein [Bacteroidota bacterium]
MARDQDLQLRLDDADFMVIDFETTGLSPESGDRVCEIGAVKLRGGAVIETFSTLINPERPISAGAYAVNGISPRMLVDAPTFSEIADKFARMLKGTILVAYNAPFDVGFLVNEFRLLGYPPITNTVIDALAVARRLLPGLGRYPQENVASVMAIPFPVKHRALEDAMVTARIFAVFSSIVKAYDCSTVHDFFRRDLASVLNAKRMHLVNDALERRQNLWIKYLSPTNFEITDRIVSPQEWVSTGAGGGGGTYLLAYCHTAKGERNFRIDRILDLRIINSTTV